MSDVASVTSQISCVIVETRKSVHLPSRYDAQIVAVIAILSDLKYFPAVVV